MPRGPGKYDRACSIARKLTNAQTCLLIVVNGDKGSGFSMQSKALVNNEGLPVHFDLPKMLHEVANTIEATMALREGEDT